MAEQLAFAGFPSATAKHRLFFAVLPDERAAAEVTRLARQLRRRHGLRGTPIEASRLHVSLASLGDHDGVPQALVAAAGAAADAVSMPSFAVAFDRVASFGGKARKPPLVLLGGDGVVGLLMLREALGAAMERLGHGRWSGHPYAPHVTLLYADRAIAEQPIEAVGWTVRELVLIHSILDEHRHIALGRWPLRGGSACQARAASPREP